MTAQAYKRVLALLLTWEDDGGANAYKGGENEFKKQMEKLADILEYGYSFDVEQWFIPSENSSQALDAKLAEFFKKDNDSKDSLGANSTLFITYYGGHAIPHPDDAADLQLVPCERNNQPHHQISWRTMMVHRLQHMLSADTLILLDCCYAARAHHSLQSHVSSPTNTVVMLAATSDDGKALADGDRTFTRNIRKQFEIFRQTSPFSIRDFYGGLRTQACKWRQACDKDEQRCIEIPGFLMPSRTQNNPMIISRISREAAISNAPPPELQQDLPKPNQETVGKVSQIRQSQKAVATCPVNGDYARRISFSSDWTVSDSTDSDEEWQSKIASLGEAAEKHKPPQKKPDASTPAPQGFYDQFHPHDNMVDQESTGSGLWSWIPFSLPKQTRPSSPPPAPQGFYDQFHPHDNMIDEERTGGGFWSEPDTRIDAVDTISARNDEANGVDVPSRKSSVDNSASRNEPSFERFLSQWE